MARRGGATDDRQCDRRIEAASHPVKGEGSHDTARRRVVLRTEKWCPEGNHPVLPQSRASDTLTPKEASGRASIFRLDKRASRTHEHAATADSGAEATDKLRTHEPHCQDRWGRLPADAARERRGAKPPEWGGQPSKPVRLDTDCRLLEGPPSPATRVPPNAFNESFCLH